MADSDFYMPEYWPANRLIGVLEHVLIEAKQIIGQLKDAQIESLKAGKITGQLTNEQIEEIEAAKIAGQLTSEQIESLEAAKISGQLVDAQIAELKAGKVKGLLTSAQIESIEATKISGQLTNAQVKEIAAAKIAGQISHSQIAAESVWAVNILAGSVTAEKIEAEAVTATKLAAGSVITSKLAAGSVVAEKIAAEAITAEKIGALQVTTAKLAAESVTAGKVAANAITAEKILAESITAIKIAAGAISAEKIAAGAVTAEKLNVKELSAITANLGTITAGVLKAVTIEAGTGSFEGKLSATELSLQEKNEILATNQIRWFNGKTLKESVSGYESSKENHAMRLNAFGERNGARVEAIGVDNFTAELARINLVAGKFIALLYDEQEKSKFMQLVKAAKLRVDWGSGEVEFKTKSLVCSAVVKHGLEAEPVNLDITLLTAGDHGIWSTPLIDAISKESFTVFFRVDSERAAGTKFKILWSALG